MKKNILFFFILFSIQAGAQVPEDAIRYSWYPQNGTARNLAIGGVMGSLGGDITAAFVNPAGLAFYKTGEIVLSPGMLLGSNTSNYRGSLSENKRNSFGFGPSGWIQGFGNKYNPTQSYAVSIGVTQVANFNNYIQYSSLNNYSSFSEQFAEEFAKSGSSIDEVLYSNSSMPYTSAPALYTYLIDTVTVGNAIQVKGAPEYILDAGQALRQEMRKKTSGGIYELALAYAQNNKDKWLMGATLGIPIVSYKSNTVFTESDTSANRFNKFNSFTYTDDFKTSGAGLNLKLGFIYRPQEYLRVGFAFHTPSFMMLTDTRTSSLNTQTETDSGTLANLSVSSQTFTNDQPGKSKYFQTSPWRAILSVSYVFREVENVKKQRAFISADIEYVNHRGSRFSSNNEEPTEEEKVYYKGLNNVVKSIYKGTFNAKVGGELKFNTIMARLGFAYYGNPYKDNQLKTNMVLLSGGLGYRDKGFFIDLSYVYNMTKDVNMPYRLEDRDNTFANIKQRNGQVMASIGWKF
ncbi:MAG TPA: hypothetical protein PLC48_04030 [Ferruginibacter sp.]|nr:hypothetical protein [Ferruginibacter sp.]